jgi:uncharacterized protein YdhG (YjbR/CyaY superfamily)
VRNYLANLPDALRSHLTELRETIRSAAPDAVESFGYGMPAFALDGKDFIWYGAWKNHVSLYPVNDEMRQALAGELASYDTSGKGTIRFPLDQDVPRALVVKLVKARLACLRRTTK